MKLSDFDFDLPEALIATRPASPRSAARLLVAEGDGIADRVVRDLADILQPGDRLVLNDTRVIPARLSGTRTRETGQGPATARIEATLLEPRPDGTWAALMKPLRKVREGEEIRFSDRLSARVERIAGRRADLRFNLAGDDFDAALAEAGDMPLPPASRRCARRTRRTRPITELSGRAGRGRWPRRPRRCISTRSCWPVWRRGASRSPMSPCMSAPAPSCRSRWRT